MVSIFISPALPAFNGVIFTDQSPFIFVAAKYFFPSNETVTFSAGLAVPQILLAFFCCNTILSVKMPAGFNCANKFTLTNKERIKKNFIVRCVDDI